MAWLVVLRLSLRLRTVVERLAVTGGLLSLTMAGTVGLTFEVSPSPAKHLVSICAAEARSLWSTMPISRIFSTVPIWDVIRKMASRFS